MFIPRESAGTLEFCRRLMEKAVGSTSRSDFAIHMAHTRSKGLHQRMPSISRRRATDALLQGLCFRYDPLANRVQYSITTLIIEYELTAESATRKLSITRATRVLTFLAELELITYQTEYDPLIGCCTPIDTTFTSALFAVLDVSEDAVVAARRSRVEWESRQREKQELDTLGIDELIAKAWHFVREYFRSYQIEFKSYGVKHACARRDANRECQDIATLVKWQLTYEISEGRFIASREAIKHEVECRAEEYMTLPRNRNYSRLATASP